nr:hypothetical protein [uncultured bacterium]
MNGPSYDFGMVGLGTMGRNLLLNIADHGFAAIGYDKDPAKANLLESSATPGTRVKGVGALADMVEQLKTPRKIMMLVPAGPIVDAVIEDLVPLLQEGDIIIDGGNSHFPDTTRRIAYLQNKKIHFMGMGVSGGEQGARTGPSIMPGGDGIVWTEVRPILEAISAKVNNEPCVAYMGKGAAGHYVKMVHNGIEYAIMQLISEVYDFLKKSLALDNDQLHTLFKTWNEGELQSFLVEITADIFTRKDDLTDNRLVDVILDKAASKGTGKWTSQEAMDLPVPLPTIDMAIGMRVLSNQKTERTQAAELYRPKVKNLSLQKDKLVPLLRDALYSATLISYAQGLAMLYKASAERQMDIPLKDVVKIWRGGCIIRSAQLEIFTAAYKKNPSLANILLDKKIAAILKKKQTSLRKIVNYYAAARIPAAALMSALAYFDSFTSERMGTNLVQAQRDYFGAHTYQRLDKEGSFHTEW